MKNITIIGYLGEDAKIKSNENANGKFETLILSVAVSESKKIPNSTEYEKKTTWFSCFKTFNNVPDFLKENLNKGLRVCITGDVSFEINNTEKGVFKNISINADTLNLLFDKKESNG